MSHTAVALVTVHMLINVAVACVASIKVWGAFR
jgi:hypothetical protein